MADSKHAVILAALAAVVDGTFDAKDLERGTEQEVAFTVDGWVGRKPPHRVSVSVSGTLAVGKRGKITFTQNEFGR